MQEKKNKRLFISLLVLTGVTGVAFWMGKERETFQVDKNLFRIENLEVIDKVVLESDSSTTTLTFNGTRWRVNEKYDADRTMITVLMATLKEAEPKRPVAASLKDSLNESLEKAGIRVSLFEGPTLKKTFFAGGNALKTQTYFQDPQTRDIYIMTIPGYRVYVSGILELDESGWRDKYAFGFNWRNFQSLQAEFPGNPAQNFKVALQKNAFGVEGLTMTDTTKLAAFMDHLFSLTVNKYLNSSKLVDSLQLARPGIILTVTDIANRNYQLKLFGEQGEEIPGLLNNNQAVIFNC